MSGSNYDFTRLEAILGKMADNDKAAQGEMFRLLRNNLSQDKDKGKASTTGRNPFGSDYEFRSRGLFDKAVFRLTKSVDLMHGSAETFVSHMTSTSRKLIGGAAIAAVISGAFNLSRSFSKMTDIGQTFGGSMLDMAAKAGESGLSLEEYASFLSKNSTATAIINSRNASSMGQLQLSVRNALKPLGFYGMSLTELTDMTSEYAETLRLTGQLDKTDQEQQSRMIAKLAGDISAFSQVTGKSREAILKDFSTAMRDPSAALRMAADNLNTQQKEAYQTVISFFSSLPGTAGQELPKFFAQLYGTGGNAYFTSLGKAAVQAGMPQINAAMSRLMGAMQSGATNISDLSVDTAIEMGEAIRHNSKGLQNLINAGGEAGAAAAQLQSLGAATQGLDRDQIRQKLIIIKEQQKQQEAIGKLTANILTFESDLHQVTGQFRLGFYEKFSEELKKFDFTGKDKATIENLKAALHGIGAAFGTILSAIFSKKNLDFLGEQFGRLSKWLNDISNDKGLVDKIIAFEQGIISVTEAIAGFIIGVESFLQSVTGMSTGLATFLTLAATIAVPKLLGFLFKTFVGGFIQRLIIRAGVAEIDTGARAGAGAGAAGARGAGGAAGGPAPAGGGRFSRMKAAGWGALKSVSRGIGGLVVGAIAGQMLAGVTDYLLPEGNLKSVIDVALEIGLPILSARFPSIGLGIVKYGVWPLLRGTWRSLGTLLPFLSKSLTAIPSIGRSILTNGIMPLLRSGWSSMASLLPSLRSVGGIGLGGRLTSLGASGIAALKRLGPGIGRFAVGAIAGQLLAGVTDYLLPEGNVKTIVDHALEFGLPLLTTLFPSIGRALITYGVMPLMNLAWSGMVALLPSLAAGGTAFAAIAAAAVPALIIIGAGIVAWAVNNLVSSMGDSFAQWAAGRSDAQQTEFKRKRAKMEEMGKTQIMTLLGLADRKTDDEWAKQHGFTPTRGGYTSQDEREVLSMSEMREMEKTGIDPVVQRSRADITPLFGENSDEKIKKLNPEDLNDRLKEAQLIKARDEEEIRRGTATPERQNEMKEVTRLLELMTALLAQNNKLTEDQANTPMVPLIFN